MSVRRILALLSAPLALAAVCGALFLWRPVEVRTSLDELIGDSGQVIPAAIRARSSSLVPVIVSARDAALARSAADRFVAALDEKPQKDFSIRYRHDGDAVARIMDFCRARRAGLVAPSAVEKLKTPEGRASLARAAARRYYSSPVPPLFCPEDDPFCLLDGFVTSLPTSISGWFPKDGVLMAERDGSVCLLVMIELKKGVADDVGRLVRLKETVYAAIAATDAGKGVSISPCGAPLHTAISAGNCKREVGVLTWFSVFFIAALSVVVFRGLRWIPLLALSLGVSVFAGLAAVLVVFGGFHLMTIVMGTTVLGLVIDYSFHWLLHGDAQRKETVRNLFVSFVTTEISLVPLMLASVPVLRQAAVFLGAGLAAALGYVVCCYPRMACAVRTGQDAGRLTVWSRLFALAVAIVTAWGLFTTEFGTDIMSVYRPPAELQAPERLFAELSGSSAADRGFVVTEGDDLERLLDCEVSLGLPPDVPCLSRFLPPLARRLGIAADVAKLYAEQGEKQAKLLGLGKLVPPSEPVAWTVGSLPAELCRGFLKVSSGLSLVVTGAPRPTADLPRETTFCRPRELIARVLSAWTVETERRLGLALLLMFVALLVFCRGRALAVFAPSVFALLSVAGLLGLLGTKINLFHLLAGFLLAGMSVDYTVFLHSGKSLKPAFCSLLTSIAGFGALVFVSFPVVQSFGLVLGVGLPIAFIAALATQPRTDARERVLARTEVAATPLGLEVLWWFYRILGLRVLHLGAACVGICVWTFSRRVRRVSPSLGKVIHFTRSLADKLVVMAEGKRLPHVETDGSADAAAFLADVKAGRGVFVLSSHCGTVEALVALGACNATFHAWMDVDRTSVFNAFYLRHARRRRVVIHPISEIGMETAFFAGDALERGDSLVMAGDRGRGAFRFAHALGAPVYFVACVWTGDGYRAIVRRLPEATAEMEKAYAATLESVRRGFPDQWFEWEK